MSQPAGTVRRYWPNRHKLGGMEQDQHGQYVSHADYRTLHAQAVALATAVLQYKKNLDDVYNHNEAARAAAIQHCGLHHNLAVIEQAQALLDAQGRTR